MGSALPSSVLVAGCGFIGHHLCQHLHQAGCEVIGLTHSENSAEQLRQDCDFRIEALDISNLNACRRFATQIPTPQAIVHCASSGRRGPEAYEQVYLGGARNLTAAFPTSTLLFTSSTSVYPQIDGEVVTETSDATPDRATGRILRQAENHVLESDGIVARLAGLYGPGRSVLLQRFLTNAAIIETGVSRFLNQLHRDDAGSALTTLLAKIPETQGEIYNVADGNPFTQRETFEQLAQHFNQPAPPEGPPDPNRKRGWTHKIINNDKLRSLGWSPTFQSFLDAVKNDPRLVCSIQKLIES